MITDNIFIFVWITYSKQQRGNKGMSLSQGKQGGDEAHTGRIMWGIVCEAVREERKGHSEVRSRITKPLSELIVHECHVALWPEGPAREDVLAGLDFPAVAQVAACQPYSE